MGDLLADLANMCAQDVSARISDEVKGLISAERSLSVEAVQQEVATRASQVRPHIAQCAHTVPAAPCTNCTCQLRSQLSGTQTSSSTASSHHLICIMY